MFTVRNTRCDKYSPRKEMRTEYKNNNDKSYLETEINVLESQVFLIVTYTTYVRLLSNSRHPVKGKSKQSHPLCLFILQ